MEASSHPLVSTEVNDLVDKLVGPKPEGSKPVQDQAIFLSEETKPNVEMVLAAKEYQPKINSKRLQQAWDRQIRQQAQNKAKELANRAIFLEEIKRKRQEKQANVSKMMNLEPGQLVEIGTKGEKADPIEIEDCD